MCVIVIGEDLGIVFEGFCVVMDVCVMFGMCVLWFECDWVGGFIFLVYWLVDVVVMMGMYDLLIVVGWW